MKYEYGNGELSSGHYYRNNMLLHISSGRRNINTKHERIGLRLHGQTRLQFRRILLINKYGFFDDKQRKKSMCQRTFEGKPGTVMSHRRFGDVLLAINWVQLHSLMIQSIATCILTSSVRDSQPRFGLDPVWSKRRTDVFWNGVGPDRQENEPGSNRFETDPKRGWTDRSVQFILFDWTGPIGQTDLKPKPDVTW